MTAAVPHIIALEDMLAHPEYLSLREIPGLHLDLRYASDNNFIGHDLYGRFDGAYLHQQAAAQLQKAVALLAARKPDWRFRVLDALRPGRVQRVLWAKVAGTPEEIYVADPDKGSIHSFGMAIDITLDDEDGNEVDMGTPFDDFTLLAHPAHEPTMLAEGRLSQAQLANRQLLRDCLYGAGFHGIPAEWWHFDAADKHWIRQHLALVE
ncbi:M15 family metallopeptidase [uncultured Aquitalea sp.]|uniref:M15 family metallopeptidase n=1 Tax=uncultured Aquitalea sp. TaxID=540272 RepID=UPI0025F3FEFB|nr:M15 family metallopeptidase [uncultured Aquitalea sp.]